MNFDSFLVKKIHSFSARHRGFNGVMKAVASYGHGAFLLYAVFLWFFSGTRRVKYRRLCVASLLSVVMASFISFLIGRCWQRKRPFLVERSVKPLISHKATPSFPSNHGMNSLAIVLSLFHGKAPGRFFLAVWAVLLAFSRVYTGVHYVTDIIGGWVIAFGIHRLVYRFFYTPVVVPLTVLFSFISDKIFRK